MEPAGARRNRLMEQMRMELVTKEDGRYLIYYSWPDDQAAEHEARSEAAAAERPPQQPWSPETGPTDV